LPKDLNETYERCLQRVQEKQQQYSLRVLRYVYQAKSPLTLDALAEALATDSKTGELRDEHVPISKRETIISSGANLIVFDEIERLVLPAHHSVRKFLDSSDAPVLKKLKSPIWDDAELNLGEMCIAHLTWHISNFDAERVESGESTKTAEQRFPSVENMSKWFKPPDQMVPRMLSLWLLKRKQAVHSSFKSGQNPVRLPISAMQSKAPRLYGAFHSYARDHWVSLSRDLTTESTTWLKFERLVHLDLKDSQNRYRRGDSQMFPWKSDSLKPLNRKILGWAIDNGHIPLLELSMTLQQDLTIPLDDYDGMLPLHLAAKRGHVNLFNKVYMRDTSWPPDVCPKTGRTALHYAAEQGCAEIVYQLLMSPDKNSNLRAVQQCDRESRTAFQLALSSGSLATIQMMHSRCGSALWDQHNPRDLLDTLVAEGCSREIVFDFLNKVNRASWALAWVVKNNDVDFVPDLVKAKVSLDSEVDPIDIDSDQEHFMRRLETRGDNSYIKDGHPAVIFALEASTPALAAAFIENGANSNSRCYVATVQKDETKKRRRNIRLRPADLALSRGWTSLASVIYPSLSDYTVHDSTDIRLSVHSRKILWLSISMDEWIITEVTCLTHAHCAFAANITREGHQKFFFANYRYEDETHFFKISVVRPEAEPTSIGLKLMMGTRETTISEWRNGPKTMPQHRSLEPEKRVLIGARGKALELDVNENAYNLQRISIGVDGPIRRHDGYLLFPFS
jgi:hypothetical protein